MSDVLASRLPVWVLIVVVLVVVSSSIALRGVPAYLALIGFRNAERRRQLGDLSDRIQVTTQLYQVASGAIANVSPVDVGAVRKVVSSQANRAIAEAFASREQFRSELPAVLERLSGLQARHAALVTDLASAPSKAGGIDVQLAALRKAHDAVLGDLLDALKRLEAAPRVFVQSEPPDTSTMRDGDIWLRLPPGTELTSEW